ncbi:MAG TPA: branched-chain amino acid ABC transporter substrate-binding protein [Gaiellaceae bacterium]
MKKATVLALAVLGTSVVAASAQGSSQSAAQRYASAAFNCKKQITMPLVTPVTGGAGFLGAIQGSWAKLAVQQIAPQLHLKVKFVLGDTPVEQGPAPAQALAQKYIGDPSVLIVLGPSTSGGVAASSAAYFQAKMAHISPSATRTSLTQGSPKDATPAFFRVVPGDYIQGPSDANFMIKNLHVKKVVIMDFQEPYSTGLAAAVDTTLKKAGVQTIRLSASNTTTDYSSYVTKVPSDADIVFFPTQKPGDAQTFAQQLIEQGKKAKVFGGDGSNDPAQFKQPGSYVSNFAPDITGIASDQSIIKAWRKANGNGQISSFGPPSYGAAQVALNAIAKACKAGHGTATRLSVFRSVKKVQIKNWILGGSFKWSTKSNDPLNAKFYIFQIQSNGSYKLVG